MKKPFKFKLPSGESVTVYTKVELTTFGLSAEVIAQRTKHLAHHWVGQSSIERDWRNSEYEKTDYMLLPYSRYKGEVLSSSSKLDDIIKYRDDLYLYEYATEQSRPIRPTWFKEY